MIIPSKGFWEEFKKTPGALSCTEALAIINIAAQAKKCGVYMELGTHKGKSALAAMWGFLNNIDYHELWKKEWAEKRQPPRAAVFIVDDPMFYVAENMKYIQKKLQEGIFKDAGFSWSWCSGLSEHVIPERDKYDYVFVDSGDHGEELVQTELKLLEDRIEHGGILAFHDFGNQFTAVIRGYEQLVATGKYEPMPIDWKEIIDYVKENNLEEGNNSWHLYPEHPFPNFVGALKRK